ncbi:MAG: AmiS/UreI family transporter [Nocardioides sp.]|uniref:AmiS/UreI family transporter n=1 Tax=Nocardioides sp. TaxID=35761 RepID=UPI0039E31261
MPPITVVFVITGLAVWLNGLAFLGIGTKQTEGSPSPLVTVGWVTLAAGIVDLINAVWIVQKLFGGDASDVGVRLAGLVTFYGIFFLALGVSLVKGLDLQPIGNLAVGVALVPLAWIPFFDGGWMFKSILIVWVASFLSVTAVIYGKLKGQVLGAVLVFTALYTFLLPAAILGSGHTIP